jgi:hypothetical protein
MPNVPMIIAADAARASDRLGFVMDWKVAAVQTAGAFSMVESHRP